MIALILLLFALGYANNLLGLFVFLLISFAITSMVIANRNMQFAKIESIQAQDVFSNQDNTISVILKNTSTTPRYDFFVTYKGSSALSETVPLLESHQSLSVQISFHPKKRGYQKLPRFELQSLYPFQMLKTWRYFYPKEEVLVYPALKGSFEYPTNESHSQNQGEQGLFRDHKVYSAGDSIRRINWIKSSQHQQILVKNYESNEDQLYNFFWEQTSRISGFEDRISQLALWIYNCERLGYSYSLTIGSKYLSSNKGLLHFRECMKLLATLQESDL